MSGVSQVVNDYHQAIQALEVEAEGGIENLPAFQDAVQSVYEAHAEVSRYMAEEHFETGEYPADVFA